MHRKRCNLIGALGAVILLLSLPALRAQEERQRERERELLAQQQRLASLARPRYLAVEAGPRHLILSLLPFGAGQFQNDQPAKGYTFLGIQLGLTVTSMTLWLAGNLLPDTDRYQESFEGLQYASWAIAGALAVTVVWGIIDGLVNYLRARRQPARWREVAEEDVPEEHRIAADAEPRPSARPAAAPAPTPAAPTSR